MSHTFQYFISLLYAIIKKEMLQIQRIKNRMSHVRIGICFKLLVQVLIIKRSVSIRFQKYTTEKKKEKIFTFKQFHFSLIYLS